MPAPVLNAHLVMLPALQAEEALWWVQVFGFANLPSGERASLLAQWREQARRMWQGIAERVDEFGRRVVTTGAELKALLAEFGVTG